MCIHSLDDETMATEEMAERISHITLAIVSDFSLFGYASEALNLRLLNLALALISEERGYALTDSFKETVVAISLKTIYHLHRPIEWHWLEANLCNSLLRHSVKVRYANQKHGFNWVQPRI